MTEATQQTGGPPSGSNPPPTAPTAAAKPDANKLEDAAVETAATEEPGTLENHFVKGSDLKPGDKVKEFGELIGGEFYSTKGDVNHTGQLTSLVPETETFTLKTMRGDVTLVFDDVKVFVAE